MTTALDLLPYAEDRVRNFPLSLEIRVPLICSPYPRWNYVTAVVVNNDLWVGQMPTDDELRMIGSFHEAYCSYWYGPPHTGWRARDLDKRPFDIDGGANGVFFIKHRHGGWGYKRRSWQYGPTFVPDAGAEPSTLLEVMDRIHTILDHPSDRWVEWKANHPEIFGGDAA